MGESKAAGVFILTDRRIIFVPRKSLTERILEPLTALLSEGLLKDILDFAREVSTGKGKVDIKELDLLKGSDFLEIPLGAISKVEAKKAYLFTNYLMVRYRAEDKDQAFSFLFGQGAKSKKDLAKRIKEAMERVH